MNYGEILTRALAVSWRHKYVWLLALFAREGAMFGLQNAQGLPGRQNGGGSQLRTGASGQVTAWAAIIAALTNAISGIRLSDPRDPEKVGPPQT
jgi:hypothetical protein